MLALFLRLLSLAYGDTPIKREKESFEVKSSAVGDTIALAESRYDELSLNISWIAPQKRLRTDQVPIFLFRETISRALLC